MSPADFSDLLAGNERYRSSYSIGEMPGRAQAGVAVLTCMDARIEPLAMLGLRIGDAKILRTPGGHLTPDALVGCVLGAHLLGVERILVVAHTRCAMASGDDDAIVARVAEATGDDLSDLTIGATPDWKAKLIEDVDTLRTHPHLSERVAVGGFLYDVDTGELQQLL